MTEIYGINFHGQEIRTAYVGGKVYFCASDICSIYMLATPGHVYSNVPDKHKIYHRIMDLNGECMRKTVLVDKYGVFNMIYRVHRKKAAFQDPNEIAEWVIEAEKEILTQASLGMVGK